MSIYVVDDGSVSSPYVFLGSSKSTQQRVEFDPNILNMNAIKTLRDALFSPFLHFLHCQSNPIFHTVLPALLNLNVFLHSSAFFMNLRCFPKKRSKIAVMWPHMTSQSHVYISNTHEYIRTKPKGEFQSPSPLSFCVTLWVMVLPDVRGLIDRSILLKRKEKLFGSSLSFLCFFVVLFCVFTLVVFVLERELRADL